MYFFSRSCHSGDINVSYKVLLWLHSHTCKKTSSLKLLQNSSVNLQGLGSSNESSNTYDCYFTILLLLLWIM